MGKETNVVVPAGQPASEKVRPKSRLDPKLENGPSRDRGCTDIICCILFILFIGGCIWVTSTAFSRGDPWKLAQPFDVDSNPCGADGKVTSVGSLLTQGLQLCLLL
jgi:hypothetical protein